MSHPPIQRRLPGAGADQPVAGDFNLRYLCEVVFRRKRTLLWAMFLTPVLSIVASLLITPSYMSSTTILLGKTEILNPLITYEMAVSMTDNDRLGGFQKIIFSRPLIEDAIHKQGLDRALHSDIEMERAVEDIRKNTHVMELSHDSFQIGFSSADTVRAKNMVEAITRLFVDRSLSSSRREADTAVTFLQREVDHYQEELKRVDRQLQEFRTLNREMLSTVKTPGSVDSYREKLADSQIELLEQQMFAQLFRDRLAGSRPMVSSALSHVQTSPFQVQYQKLQLDMGELLSTRKENHPEVLKKQRELDFILDLLKKEKEEEARQEANSSTEIRTPVYQETLAHLDDTVIKIKSQEEKIRELRRQEDEFLQKLARTPLLVQEEMRLDDEAKLTRQIYDKLCMKLEEARVTRAVEIEQQANRYSIIEPARVPLKHYKPKRILFALAGALGGIFLGLSLVFLLEITDPRLVRSGELQHSVGLPLLGAIPRLYRDTRRAGWYIPAQVQRRYARTRDLMQGSPRQWIVRLGQWLPDVMEGFDHLLRWFLCARRFELPESMPATYLLPAARLSQAGLSRHPRELTMDDFIERIRHIGISIRAGFESPDHLICLVTSAKRGEGKTLLTANLGVVLASDLKKPILLVDACMENAGLSALFGRAQAPGLGDLLDGRASLDAVLVQTDTPNLWLLPAGRTHEYADVLFNDAGCRQRFDELRDRFSMILVETQNLGMQSDAVILAPYADGVLLLGQLYSTKKKVIEAVMQRLPRDKVLGLVTNYGEYWIPDWLYRWV